MLDKRRRSEKSKDGGRVTFSPEECGLVVALAGNPNVGKSTLFNSLTGMRVHTGNWAGKTVEVERAHCECGITFVDIPGTYSLLSHSDEEKIARDYIVFGGADVTVVVCDACALAHNLALVLQIIETGTPTVVAVNMMDEAKRMGVRVELDKLSRVLGVPVVGTVAHKRATLSRLVDAVGSHGESGGTSISYPETIENAILPLYRLLVRYEKNERRARFLALRLIDSDEELKKDIIDRLGLDDRGACEVFDAIDTAVSYLFERGITLDGYTDAIVLAIVGAAEEIAASVSDGADRVYKRTWRIDRIFTGRFLAYPAMLLLLTVVLFITLSLASYPSAWLSAFFSFAEVHFGRLLTYLSAPEWLHGLLLEGIWRTLGQVVAVMLPPMVIFFPLFSLLEDSGYLPRVAYNLDRPFCACGACGKQALTMCMGLGCNAVGIVGCRIIDSPRERKLAVLTNSLMPCNGRFPMLVTLITVFYLFWLDGGGSWLVALTLSFMIVLSVAATLLVTYILSRTLLRGERSAFTIEQPPYRRPRFFQTVFHSLTDKCASVLLRAAVVALPMGALIWIMAFIKPGGISILAHVSDFLEPLGRFFGMDGAILLAFMLGIPANEIVIPILVVIYSSASSIGAQVSTSYISALLVENGWTPITAVCTAVFALFHWPCSTSLITVYKETKSLGYTVLAFLIPTVVGLSVCAVIATLSSIFI